MSLFNRIGQIVEVVVLLTIIVYAVVALYHDLVTWWTTRQINRQRRK
jgi:putative effector of murein hydrolase LrgA (UPF0299 family)